MKLSRFLFTSIVAIGLVFVSRHIFSTASIPPLKLLRKIEIRCRAVEKSAQLALEKSSSLFLREIAQHLREALAQEEEQFRAALDGDNSFSRAELIDIESLRFNYDYNEDSPFDLSYASHQLKECEKIIALLQQAQDVPNASVKDLALRLIPVFSRYQTVLATFLENFMEINEYRIREFAYQIWEAEGRPEGESERHWEKAVELLHSASSADLQLALEQRRPLIGSFSPV